MTRWKENEYYNLRLNNIVEILNIIIDEEFKYIKNDDDDQPMPEQPTKFIHDEERAKKQTSSRFIQNNHSEVLFTWDKNVGDGWHRISSFLPVISSRTKLF